MLPSEGLPFSGIENRGPLKLPDGMRVVLWPVLALEHWDINRPMARMVISPPQGVPQQPDHPNWSWHEYGMRWVSGVFAACSIVSACVRP